MPNDVPDWSQLVSLGQGPVSFASITVTGILGATNTSRWVGAVSGAAPTGGPYNQGDWATDLIGGHWTCSSGGSPGTWLWVPALTAAGDLVLPSSGRGSGAIQGTSLKALSDTNPQATIDTVSTGKQGVLGFRSAGAAKWDIFKQTDDNFHILDRVSGLDWLIVTTGDVATLAGPLGIPTALGGALPTTGWGTVAPKADEQTPAGASGTITIPASGSIPSWVRRARISFKLRTNSANVTDNITMRFNADSGNNYEWESFVALAGATTPAGASGSSFGIGTAPGGGATAGLYVNGWVEIVDPGLLVASSRRGYNSMCGFNSAGSRQVQITNGEWTNTSQALTTVQIIAAAGSWLGWVGTEYYP